MSLTRLNNLEPVKALGLNYQYLNLLSWQNKTERKTKIQGD